MSGALLAILLCVQDLPKLMEEGDRRLKADDLDGAIETFSKAVELDPKFVPAWYLRGLARSRKGDGAGAIADFSKALELDPAHAFAWSKRGLERYFLGELDGARTDLTRGLELYPDDPLSWYVRGCIGCDQARWTEAQADLKKALEKDKRGRQTYVPRIWQARARAGERGPATEDLLKETGNADPKEAKDSFHRLAFFLGGKLAEADYARSAEESKEAACFAWFWIGQKRLIDGNRDGAREAFAKSTETKLTYTAEFRSATAELAALKK